MVRASNGQPRNDVASALGTPYWANSGFTATFSEAGLAVGPNLLVVYAHAPDKGWWYRQLQVSVPAAPARAYADDPLLIVRQATPSLDVAHTTSTLTLTGYAIDRNLPTSAQVGAGGSGVSSVQAYLDGPRTPGNGAGQPHRNRHPRTQEPRSHRLRRPIRDVRASQIDIHPSDLSVERHVLYIYADSAYWPNETLVVIPFNIH